MNVCLTLGPGSRYLLLFYSAFSLLCQVYFFPQQLTWIPAICSRQQARSRSWVTLWMSKRMTKGAAASTGDDRVQCEPWESCWITGISMLHTIMVHGSRDEAKAADGAGEDLTKQDHPRSLTMAEPTCIIREEICRLVDLGEGPPCIPTTIQLPNGGGWMRVHARACTVTMEAICRHLWTSTAKCIMRGPRR